MKKLFILLEITLLIVFSYALGHDAGIKQKGVRIQSAPATGCPYLDSMRGSEICPYLRGGLPHGKPGKLTLETI